MSVIEKILVEMVDRRAELVKEEEELREQMKLLESRMADIKSDIAGLDAMLKAVPQDKDKPPGKKPRARMGGLSKVVEGVTREVLMARPFGFMVDEDVLVAAVKRRAPDAIAKSIRSSLRRHGESTENRICLQVDAEGNRSYYLTPEGSKESQPASQEMEVEAPDETVFNEIAAAGKEGKSIEELAWLVADEQTARTIIERLVADLRLDEFHKHGVYRVRARDTGDDGLTQQNLFSKAEA